MVKIEDWQARLILRVMNTAAPHYTPEQRTSNEMLDLGVLREWLESHVGLVDRVLAE
jgi:hypothetical protein